METIFRDIASEESAADRELRLLRDEFGRNVDPVPTTINDHFSAQLKQQAATDVQKIVEADNQQKQQQLQGAPKPIDKEAGNLHQTDVFGVSQMAKETGITENLAQPAAGYFTGLAKGTGKSIENIWNLIDTVDNLQAKTFQQPDGGYIGRANFGITAQNKSEQLGMAFGQYVLPFLAGGAVAEAGAAGMGVTSAVAKGGMNMATNAAVNFLVGDPKGERFMKVVADNYPELLKPVSEYFNSKPGESEAEGRLKNAIDGLIPDALLAGGIFLTATTIGGLAARFKPQRVVQAEKMTAKGLESGTLLPGQSIPPHPIYVDDIVANAELRKALSEQNATVVPEKAVQNPVVKESIVEADKSILPSEVKVSDTSGTETMESIKDYIGRKSSESAKTGPQTMTDIEKKAATYVAQNPEEFRQLIKDYKSGDKISDTQRHAIHFFVQDLFNNMYSAFERAKKTGLAVDVAASEKKMLEFYNIANSAEGAAESAGRNLRVLQAERTVTDVEKFNSATQVVKTMGGMQEGVTNAEKITRMNKVLKEQTGVSLFGAMAKGVGKVRDAVNFVGLNGLASASAARNAVSGAIRNVGNAITDVNMMVLGIIPDSDARIAAEAAKESLIGNFSAIKEATYEAIHTAKTGETFLPTIYNFEQFTKTEAERVVLEGTSSTPWYSRVMSSLVDNGKTGLELVGQRPNKIQDAFNGMIAYRRSIIQQAVSEGRHAGLLGDSLEKYVNARIAAPSKSMHQSALVAAKEPTLALKYEEMLGKNALAKFMGSADNFLSATGLAPAVPFLRAKTNEVILTLEHIPGLAVMAPRTAGALMKGGTARYEAIAKMMVGAEIIGGAYVLNKYAGIQFTGNGPTDKMTMAALQHTNPGYMPYSVGLPNGKHFSYDNYGPLTNILKMYGDYSELSAHLEEGEKVKFAWGMVSILADALTPKQLTQDLPSVIDAIRALGDNPDPEKFQRLMAEHAMNFMPLSGAIRSVRRDADPYKREMTGTDAWDSFKNQFINQVPGWSMTLPPKRNRWGEVVAYPQGINPTYASPFFTSTGEDNLSKEMMRLGIYNTKLMDIPPGATKMQIEMPSKVFSFNVGGSTGSLRLNAHEYDQMLKFSAGLEFPNDSWQTPAALSAADITPEEANIYVDKYTDSSGNIVPLKKMVADLIQEVDRELPKNPTKNDLLKSDEEKRLMVKAAISAYDKMGRAAMYLSPRIYNRIMTGAEDRARIFGE